MEFSINGLMLSVIVCAIFVMSIACGILWIKLARTKERYQALEADNRRLESQDSLEIAQTLLGKLSTMPRHKQQMIMSWTKEHRPWYERQVHSD